jgi:hypothetical protein
MTSEPKIEKQLVTCSKGHAYPAQAGVCMSCPPEPYPQMNPEKRPA